MTQRAMHTTRPFMSGRCQAVRIPKEYRLDDVEVVINQVGESIVITPKEALQQMFFSGIAELPGDFLREGRPEETENERIIL